MRLRWPTLLLEAGMMLNASMRSVQSQAYSSCLYVYQKEGVSNSQMRIPISIECNTPVLWLTARPEFIAIIRVKKSCILANYSSKPRCLLTGFWFLLSQILDFVPGLEVAFSDKQVYMLRRLTMTIPATVRGKTTAYIISGPLSKGFKASPFPPSFMPWGIVVSSTHFLILISIVAEAEGLGWSAFHEPLVANRSTKMVCT